MKNLFITLVLLSGLFLATAPVLAEDFGLNKTAGEAGYEIAGSSTTVANRVQTVVTFVLGFVAILFFGLTLYGGFIWLTARGKDERVSKAKETLEAAIIGLVIVGAAYAVANFVLDRLTNISPNTNSGACEVKDPSTDTEVCLDNFSKEMCDSYADSEIVSTWSQGKTCQ